MFAEMKVAEMCAPNSTDTPIGEPMKKYLQVFNLFYKIKKYIFGCAGAPVPRGPRPGPRRPMP